MSGALRKTMLYLGLADDHGEYEQYEDQYDDYEPEAPVVQDHDAQVTPIRQSTPRAARQAAPSDLRRITTVHPRSYNDAREIGEAFRAGTPVIMNLGEMKESDARRLVDFSAGLTFGLNGVLERVTSKVFLLSPEHVEVTGEERATTSRTRSDIFNQT